MEAWLNTADGRKKRIFHYRPTDELLFRTVNRLLQPAAAEAASPWCRSFRPGGGTGAAFRSVLTDDRLASGAAVRSGRAGSLLGFVQRPLGQLFGLLGQLLGPVEESQSARRYPEVGQPPARRRRPSVRPSHS